MQVPPPHTSVTDFINDVKAEAQADGDATVLAMGTNQSIASPPPDTDSDEDSEETSGSEQSGEDEEGIVGVGDLFVYSDEEEGESTFTVRRITRNGIVYVREDDDPLCLTYVRKKVTAYATTNTTRGSRRSTRTTRRINYDENIDL